jgi:GT2 family glycosyltransferase
VGDLVSTPLAGVVIVHFGEVDPTIRCTASVCGDPSRFGRRVIVVDNSGNLEADALVSGVEVIHRPDNPGFGAAVNVGVAALEGDEEISFYVVLNNDAVLGPGYLDAAADALEVGVGAAGGPIRDGFDNSRLWYAGGSINFLTGTVRQQRFADASGQGRDVGYIPATAMAVAATAWRNVGGFDERFFLYNEDLDLCLRLRRAGWRLRFEPRMETFHRLGGSTGSAERSPLYLENLTATRFLPFQSKLYRAYLGGVHTMYNSLRMLGLCVRHTTRCAPYVAAVARGHARALRSVFS